MIIIESKNIQTFNCEEKQNNCETHYLAGENHHFDGKRFLQDTWC